MHKIALRTFLVLFCICLSLDAATADDKFPSELTAFEPYKANPVFTAAGPGHWDVKIRERGYILHEDDTYRMWYTGYDGTRDGIKLLGYATSPDGLRWTRYSENPIYRDGWVEDMMVVKNGDTYYMFAEGANETSQLLASPDGVHWASRGLLDIRLHNGSPIKLGPFGTPTAWHEAETWYLFYERNDLGIYLATSKDLNVWTNIQDEPVLSLGPGQYDGKQIALNQIVKHDGRYYGYYHGSPGGMKPFLWNTDVSVSDDLKQWEKFAGNPLFPNAENKSSGILVHDGTQYRLYTMHDHVDVHFPRQR